MTTTASNRINTKRQSGGPAIPRHHVREILRSKPREHGPSGNYTPSVEAELRCSPRGTARQKAQARIQIAIQRRLVARGNNSQSPTTSAHRHQETCLQLPQGRKWIASSRYFSHDINRIFTTWRDKVIDKSKKTQNEWALMDTTGIGSQQLLTYTQTQVQNCEEAQTICVRNLLHGKLMSNLRLKIN